MEIFKGQNLIEFSEHFKTDNDCKKYLSEIKWKDNFTCSKCGNTTSQIRKDHSRTCNKCSHTETASSNTLFHRVRFGLRKAFFIVFEMSTTTKSFSATQMGVRYGVTEKTARLFMHKVREAMKSSGNHPIYGIVDVDEFVIGGKEKGKVGRSYDSNKKKIVCSVELTESGKVKRMYALQIDNYSSKELNSIFEKHISEDAQVHTDQWKGYRPLSKKYNITQSKSEGGVNFKALHTMIHQIKSWLRTTYSWISPFNVNRYLDEFCYRINRSQSKNNIFNNLIERMVVADKKYQSELICS